jgi:DNA-binding response OmpR family regulator
VIVFQRPIALLEYGSLRELVSRKNAAFSEEPRMSSTVTALMVDDDQRLAGFTAEHLEHHGVKVTKAIDGDEALRQTREHTFDVIVIDLMAPLGDGLNVCREIRTFSTVPIIILTAQTGESDRLRAFESGADDYMAKPFSPRELLARIRAVVRRVRGNVGPAANATLQVGPLMLRGAAMTATWRGEPLELTSYEFSILRVMIERRGHVLSREEILDLAKGSAEEAFDRSIDVRVSRLRQKLPNKPDQPSIIRTIRGAGYMLAWNDEDS